MWLTRCSLFRVWKDGFGSLMSPAGSVMLAFEICLWCLDMVAENAIYSVISLDMRVLT